MNNNNILLGGSGGHTIGSGLQGVLSGLHFGAQNTQNAITNAVDNSQVLHQPPHAPFHLYVKPKPNAPSAPPPRVHRGSGGVAPNPIGVPHAPTIGGGKTPTPAKPKTVKPVNPNIAINKQVADYVAASQQAANRAQQFYQQQTGDQQATTTANASALAQAAGSLSNTNPALYSASNNPLVSQLSNGYTDLINHVSGTSAAANASANQAHIADSGNALQKLFAGNRNAVSMQNVEYNRQLQNSVPALRAKAISDQQAAALKAASAQYLNDKLGVTQQNNQANQALGVAKLNAENQRFKISQQTKADLAGANLNMKTQGAIQKWIDTHLMAKSNKLDSGGHVIASASVARNDVPYHTILDELSTYSPPSAIRTAIRYGASSIKQDGPDNFFAALQGYVSKRQAIKYATQVFGKKIGNQLRLYGTATPATAVNSASQALALFGR